jgi:acetyl esterase
VINIIKVWTFRLYYLWINYWNWRGVKPTVAWKAITIPSLARPIGARHYTAENSADKPLIVFFHGGGWVIGDLRTHHAFCCQLNASTGCPVVAVDYALAPESPFPAGPGDCLAAVKWIARNLENLGRSNQGMVLAGDSAGGNLALATCLELDEFTRERIAGVCAIYPGANHYQADYPSYTERGSGEVLTTNIMKWFWDTYLAGLDPDSPEAANAFPLRSDKLASLPPTLLVTAEYDPLRDEGRALADRLQTAGVPLAYRHFENAAHGFACSEGRTEDFDSFMKTTDSWVRQLG